MPRPQLRCLFARVPWQPRKAPRARHDTASGNSPTRWVTGTVIVTHHASRVVEEFDRLGVAGRMRTKSPGPFVVTQDAGQIIVNAWPRGE